MGKGIGGNLKEGMDDGVAMRAREKRAGNGENGADRDGEIE